MNEMNNSGFKLGGLRLRRSALLRVTICEFLYPNVFYILPIENQDSVRKIHKALNSSHVIKALLSQPNNKQFSLTDISLAEPGCHYLAQSEAQLHRVEFIRTIVLDKHGPPRALVSLVDSGHIDFVDQLISFSVMQSPHNSPKASRLLQMVAQLPAQTQKCSLEVRADLDESIAEFAQHTLTPHDPYEQQQEEEEGEEKEGEGEGDDKEHRRQQQLEQQICYRAEFVQLAANQKESEEEEAAVTPGSLFVRREISSLNASCNSNCSASSTRLVNILELFSQQQQQQQEQHKRRREIDCDPRRFPALQFRHLATRHDDDDKPIKIGGAFNPFQLVDSQDGGESQSELEIVLELSANQNTTRLQCGCSRMITAPLRGDVVCYAESPEAHTHTQCSRALVLAIPQLASNQDGDDALGAEILLLDAPSQLEDRSSRHEKWRQPIKFLPLFSLRFIGRDTAEKSSQTREMMTSPPSLIRVRLQIGEVEERAAIAQQLEAADDTAQLRIISPHHHSNNRLENSTLFIGELIASCRSSPSCFSSPDSEFNRRPISAFRMLLDHQLEAGKALRVLVCAWHNAARLFVHQLEPQLDGQSERLEAIHAALNQSEFGGRLRTQIESQQKEQTLETSSFQRQFCELLHDKAVTQQQHVAAFFVLSPDDDLIYRAVAINAEGDYATSIMDCIIVASNEETGLQIRVRLADFGNEMLIGLERTSLCIASSEAMANQCGEREEAENEASLLGGPGCAVRCCVIDAEMRARLRNTQQLELDEMCRERLLIDHEQLIMIVLRNRSDNNNEAILVDLTGPSMGSLRHHVAQQQLCSFSNCYLLPEMIAQQKRESHKTSGNVVQERDEEVESKMEQICARLELLENRIMQH